MENKTEYKKIALFLCNVPRVGPRSVKKLIDEFGSMKNIYEADEDRVRKVLGTKVSEGFILLRKRWDLDREYERLSDFGIKFVSDGDAEYPEKLKKIPDPPIGLFYMGNLPENEKISVAVVGARDCSEYGKYVAAELGRRMGQCDIQVISGMARGIDGISQLSCMEAGGKSYAVLGSGVDVCYPEDNRRIYDKLKKCGGIISPYPPGMKALAQNFPPRNRIVSGLSDVLVVVEAKMKSGTLITVDMALEQGKDVYVVPGRITDRLSDGCNSLMSHGAGVVLSPDEFVKEILGNSCCLVQNKRAGGVAANQCMPGENAGKKSSMDVQMKELPDEIREVAMALDFTPQDIEKIRSRVKIDKSSAEISTMLMRLVIEGVAEQVSPGFFIRRV